ncbi:MAG: DEAD/DEAH box helicase [Methylococcales bacterium]|nr:DEAD/DEAH box helicase [Methylococcales bacterium]MBT7408115.1 DEAD/DEAH box helicase [Methylococcales bacterium]
MTTEEKQIETFKELELSSPILKTLDQLGYESPTPIQAQIIPHMLAGSDVLGQAQTGTGKTAAFALPLLNKIDINNSSPQVLVLAPTRELAIQVAESFQQYASNLKGFHILPIYGGQEYGIQLRQLKRGVHIVVGTPGRVIDHLKRGTLKLDTLKCLVLDEADEMLRMGFIDDVEWILEQSPDDRQIALFSATMPTAIKKISKKYLHNPEEITIKLRTTTAETIRQRFWLVSGVHKLDALTRILEVEHFKSIIVFVRTKIATVELAEKLEARGYISEALNGDIIQKQREHIIEKLKAGKVDILVATDVAARGLDVDNISHVINYDIPHDTESYVHRIGRTGRAGKSGDAILFVAPREKRLLYAIERATKQKIEVMELPSTELINEKRIKRFTQDISDTLANDNLQFFYKLLEQYQEENNVAALDIAAALAKLVQGDKPLLLKKSEKIKPARDKGSKSEKFPKDRKDRKTRGNDAKLEEGMERFRIEVGHDHDVKPGHIVGAIANEADIDNQHIGKIKIYDDHSTVDLPEGMPKEVFNLLKKVWIFNQQLKISRLDDGDNVYKKKKKKKRHSKNKGNHEKES